MSAGLQATSQVIATSCNRSVLALIERGLCSSDPSVRTSVLRAALGRHDLETHSLLIQCYGEWDATDRAIYCDALRQVPQRAAPALRRALLGPTGEGSSLRERACSIIVATRDYDQLSALLQVIESSEASHGLETVRAAIVGLVGELRQSLAEWENGMRTGALDPSASHRKVLHALEAHLAGRPRGVLPEVLHAFVTLAPFENPVLQQVLSDEAHPLHAATLAILRQSSDSSIFERLVMQMRDANAPMAVLQVIANRNDLPFLKQLLHGLRHPVPLRVLYNMQRLDQVAWLEEKRELLLEVDGRAQAAAIELASASNLDRAALFELLAMLLKEGLAEGRRASCQALAAFSGSAADALIRAALDDPDASVKSAAIRQLRARRLPEALEKLAEYLESTVPEIRDAARSSLAEFSFARFRAMFDLLGEAEARATGHLVRKIDHTASQKLIEELHASSIMSRLRGIEMAVAMAATDDLQPQLIELARHENDAIRREAILALGHSARAEGESVLAAASRDPNRGVAEAARQSLLQRRHRRTLSENDLHHPDRRA
ncbi:MAG: HEAT repeat domain-containing protein [Pirellulales bacterium]|nr:HEAT repeat domain-containing protein [Pirellulales bacterium]